mmetsp:Transcript_22387/g.41729  ORF Transcript_22387/g.41729 Transcript_22387/m.41729 type:complete len:95 (-) Transcript_22387:513-797(-)
MRGKSLAAEIDLLVICVSHSERISNRNIMETCLAKYLSAATILLFSSLLCHLTSLEVAPTIAAIDHTVIQHFCIAAIMCIFGGYPQQLDDRSLS